MSFETDMLDLRIGSLMSALTTRPSGGERCAVNDIHSRLNETLVRRIVPVRTTQDARAAILEARDAHHAVCIAGGWHAMGGQQFATDGILLDTRRFAHVVAFDAERGLIEVQAGMQWPELVDAIRRLQQGEDGEWGISQKQTGADRLSIGGAVSANVHGRGLTMAPFVSDVEALTLLDANGGLRRCSRQENAELFRLVVGGYGLFGFIATVTLRLAPRRLVRRDVEVLDAEQLMTAFETRIAEGFLYGDFQFAIDPASDEFLRRGILSSYQPVPNDTPMPKSQRAFTVEDWRSLIHLAHVDKSAAFERYAWHYLSTTGQLYWSDSHQMSTYIDDYHAAIDQRLGAPHPATEVIGELHVPPRRLADFMDDAREHLRASGADLVYGTIRLIERDDESFLPWARDRYACVIFNLHTPHTDEGLARTADDYRMLIDLAIRRGGSYYLTYHRWARKDQLLACYPRFPEMLSRKLAYDPEERFQSDWYRCYRDLLRDSH